MTDADLDRPVTEAELAVEAVARPTDDSVQANVAARKVADEVKQMCEDACNEASHPSFTTRLWELLRDHALQEVGMPVRKAEVKRIEPLDKECAKLFAKDEMPRGKYVEETVEAVYAKDPEHLKEFAGKLDWWQVRLQRYLAYMELQEKDEANKQLDRQEAAEHKEKKKLEKERKEAAEKAAKEKAAKGKPAPKKKGGK